MSNFLVLSAMGPDRAGLVDGLSQFILQQDGNITESRMAVLGGEFALIMLIDGSEDSIQKIEAGIDECQQSLGLTILSKRTSARQLIDKMLPYNIEVVSMDHPGIVREVADFFAQRKINIEQMETSSYAAPHTGTTMFAMRMTIGIPAEQAVGKLKQAFYSFCDELNLDADMEAEK
ncbi:MAG: glycine cleavage system protein R [Gammaproteobacteria bacterium]|nr:glycine cleavage system protein R [Gammaproteobacteria bacterium]